MAKKRKSFTEAEKKEMIARIQAAKASGKSVLEAIKAEGITAPSYYNWLRGARPGKGKKFSKSGAAGIIAEIQALELRIRTLKMQLAEAVLSE